MSNFNYMIFNISRRFLAKAGQYPMKICTSMKNEASHFADRLCFKLTQRFE